jgi:hypothetical protein
MSKVKITGHASGSGTLTLTGPNTNSDRTVTMPDATGTMLMTDGSGASLTALPSGSVIQVVTATTGTNTQVTSTSYADTTLTANITPSSASNKVLVLATQQIQGERTADTEFSVYVQLLRDATSIQIIIPLSIAAGVGDTSKITMRTTGSIIQLDSPSTTSAITYKTQGKISTTANSATCRFQESTAESSIVLMEIAG